MEGDGKRLRNPSTKELLDRLAPRPALTTLTKWFERLSTKRKQDNDSNSMVLEADVAASEDDDADWVFASSSKGAKEMRRVRCPTPSIPRARP